MLGWITKQKNCAENSWNARTDLQEKGAPCVLGRSLQMFLRSAGKSMGRNPLQTQSDSDGALSFPHFLPNMSTKFQDLLRWQLLCNETYHIEIFTVNKKIFVIFLNTNSHQWSAVWQLKLGKSVCFQIYFALQMELFLNNWEDFLVWCLIFIIIVVVIVKKNKTLPHPITMPWTNCRTFIIHKSLFHA